MEPLAQTLREEAKAPSKYRAAPANLKVRRRENKHPQAEILRTARRQAARRLPIPWCTRNSEELSVQELQREVIRRVIGVLQAAKTENLP